ncbi:iron-sulfur cluster biosynthesis family protein [Priestia flexa]|uniref:iron-sulfur cluster biosynthesis family protein n=1 Tax=Priestia flexa TaxID=86664 RepID=UPI003D2EAC39
MNITFTNRALEKVAEKYDQNSSLFLKLKYDTDGCGCVVSGVTSLWIVADKEFDDDVVSTNGGDILVEKTKQVFMDDNMTIDYSDAAGTFMLKSPSQILNPRMSIIDQSAKAR